MRIVGGKYKGRVLCEFKGKAVRPTSDMARESIFNILQTRIYGAHFLDLFSGTGAMGIEALSRGARKVVFNDIDRESVKIIKTNIEKLKVSEDYSVYNYNALTLLDIIQDKFDIIFMDPPYNSGLDKSALEKVSRIMNDNSIVILEDDAFFGGEVDGLEIIDKRKYGKVHLTFFGRSEL